MSLSPPLKLPIPSTLSLSIGYDPSRIPELHCSTPALHTTLLYCKLLLMHLSPDPYLMLGVVTGRMKLLMWTYQIWSQLTSAWLLILCVSGCHPRGPFDTILPQCLPRVPSIIRGVSRRRSRITRMLPQIQSCENSLGRPQTLHSITTRIIIFSSCTHITTIPHTNRFCMCHLGRVTNYLLVSIGWLHLPGAGWLNCWLLSGWLSGWLAARITSPSLSHIFSNQFS